CFHRAPIILRTLQRCSTRISRVLPGIPEAVQANIEQLCVTVPQRELAAAAQELSDSYRNPDLKHGQRHLPSRTHHLAYLAVRFPATFSAICRALAEIPQLVPWAQVGSILDLGAGPGTATFAAGAMFPTLR